jgi:energy-coupling factor transporter transmembrane protein EcfT
MWLLATGVLAIALTIRIASRRNLRTRFRRQKPGLKDALVAVLALVPVVLVVVL